MSPSGTVNLFMTEPQLAKSFSDAAIGTFLRMLAYKAEWQNKRVVKVGRFFASSKTCHCCHHKQSLTLSDRQWTCAQCHTLHARDINAAVNIRCEGMRLLAAGTADSLNADGESVSLAKVSSSC